MLKFLRSNLRLFPVLLLLTLLGASPLPLSARNFTYNYEGKTIYYTVIDESAKTCKTMAGDYSNTPAQHKIQKGSLILPEHPMDGKTEYTLVEIGEYSFSECTGLTSVTIPESVTTIGADAFSGCSGLKSVTIPNSMTSIKKSAFYDCSGLTKAEFASVESLCSIKFDYYYEPANPLYYAHNLYINGQEVKDLVIPNTVTSISAYAFYGCSGLKSVTIPNSMTSIGKYAFHGCIGLTKAEFASIEALCSIEFDDRANPLIYAQNLFIDGQEVKDLVIPNMVTTIGANAFSGCSGLTSVTIPSSVTTIGSNAFRDCYGLMKAEFESIESLCSIKFGDDSANPLYRAHNLYINGQEVKDLIIPNTVTTIGAYAFYGCDGLTSVSIPSSVISIGDYAFGDNSDYGDYGVNCSGLTKAEFSSVEALCSIKFSNSSANPLGYAHNLYINGREVKDLVIPSSVTILGEYAFIGCDSLTSVTIPNSVTAIGEMAFYDCSGLTKADFASVESLCSIDFGGWDANPLEYVHSLYINGREVKDLIIPNSVTRIGAYAFSGCSRLTSVTIPESVTTIGADAFYGCSGLTSVTIPSTVTSFDKSAFAGCVLKPLLFEHELAGDEKIAINLESGSVILCRDIDISKFTVNDGVNVYSWDLPYVYESSQLILGVKISAVSKNPRFDGREEYGNLQGVIYQSNDSEVKRIDITDEPEYIIKDLQPKTDYTLKIMMADTSGVSRCLYTYPFQTSYLSQYKFKTTEKTTQTSATIKVSYPEADESVSISEMGIQYNNKRYLCNDGRVVLENLLPDMYISYKPYFIYNDGKELLGYSESMYTQGWDVDTDKSIIHPTSASLKATFTEDDAEAERWWWEFNGERVDGSDITVQSIAPGSTHSAKFNILYKNKTYSYTKNFETPEVTFTTLNPKCVSSTCAIVAAETNISDLEPRVGFQWKKYDAPATLAPKEAYAAVNDGVLEGYIRNLQPTSYYDVRPFYKDANDNYYYGEWVTFDPSDFSYFEPTVKTYPVQNMTASTVTVRGYALAGTDNIKRQGFQYWKTGSVSAQDFHTMATPEAVNTVEATGQIMTATLENLEPGTTYTYRAFVETDAGHTYGEEHSFTTEEGQAGIGVIGDDKVVTVVGYFDLAGRRYDKPQRGFNIVVYSNGTTKKMLY